MDARFLLDISGCMGLNGEFLAFSCGGVPCVSDESEGVVGISGIASPCRGAAFRQRRGLAIVG